MALCAPSPGGVLPQGIKIAMISGGDHTTIYRWAGEAGSEEERRYLRGHKKLEQMRDLNIFARIPLQSKIGSGGPIFASFPPGEAVCAAAQMRGRYFIAERIAQVYISHGGIL